MKRGWRLIKILITISFGVLVIPLLIASLAMAFPAKPARNNVSYEGTDLSYFAADKWVSEDTRKDFEDVVYFFEDVDWSKYTSQILKACFNPGEAAKLVEEELHIDPAELLFGARDK